ncbi:Carboxypeptidase regulatory-like domain-containing protein [Bryocella elongata]|uniref:Carboxypeptidase regulatory-like domain-containing protein n=1 Tax=Bryocella elongata TaxID=863522 RepID=A0A1H6C288_9BACT|nr:carboxypeptidase-like regulatory domain-containing protein [Bryocella elongata]SEG67084.1 Carboxypeptidase regulatory-like domain-containing protein [Bryocella elongata]
MKVHLRYWMLAASLALASAPLGRAQSGSSVEGTVTDSTGAVIPNANITLTNTSNGTIFKASTDSQGAYSFPALSPGLYSLEVTKDSFGSYKVASFNLVVGQKATENAKLGVSASDQVVVEASGLSNLIDPSSNDMGTVIGPQSVENLPLNNRNFLQLALLSGAAFNNSGAANNSIAQTGHPGLSINVAGNEPDYTMYLLNGLETVGSRAANNSLNISTEAIDQFEVHYGFFMPDLGPNPAVVDTVTKSGTNKYHGEVYEYNRNSYLQARNYFAISAGVPQLPGPYNQNQFGFYFGGPVLHDKLFFFTNYEGYRQILTAVSNAVTPTSAMLGGDFSALSTPIYDPTTFNPVTLQRTQFPGNKIPAARISSSIQTLLGYYAAGPAISTSQGRYYGSPKTTLNSDQFTGRIDYNLGPKHQVFAQGTWLNSPYSNPGLFPGQGAYYPLDTEYVALGWNWTLNSRMVNEFRAGVVRDAVYDEGATVPGLQQKLNITGTEDPNGVPGINISGGYAGFGASTGLLGDIDNIYQIHDSFNWLKGNHQIKFGAIILYSRNVQSSANANARGVFTFNDTYTAQLNGTSAYTVQANTGNAFADFLLGDLSSGQSIGMPKTHFRWTTASPYIEDTWKVSPTLTANVALAWFGSTTPNPVGSDKNLIHSFDFNTGLETFAALGQTNPEVYPMTMTNWAPRVGIAWSPTALKNTTIRAGWGLYYTTQMDVNAQYSVVSEYITVNSSVTNTQPNPTYVLGVNAMPAVTTGQITPTQAANVTGAIQYLGANNRTPYISQWNLDVQHNFGTKYLLDIAYIGNESHHLALNFDPIDCSSVGSYACNNANNPYYPKYPYIQEASSIGYGNYNSLLVKFQRQFADGFSLITNFNYSKALAAAQQGSNGTLNQNRSCIRCDYGLTTSDVPLSLVISAVAELPFGKSKPFLHNVGPVVNEIVGGWSIDAIATMQRGTPFTITAPNRTVWSPANIHADETCNGHKALANKNVRTNGNFWMAPAVASVSPCYADPYLDHPATPGVIAWYGNAGFDDVIGPGLNNWDLGAHKAFAIYRDWKFTLRGEFFNAFNHTQFGNPASGIASNATFGQITSTSHDNRIVQIGGTLNF